MRERDMRLAANKKRRETIWFSQRLADRCHASSYILLWVMEFTHLYRLSARFSMKIQLIGRHKNARPLSINRDVSSHFFAIFNLQAPFSSFRNGSQKLSADAYISARLSKAKQEDGHTFQSILCLANAFCWPDLFMSSGFQCFFILGFNKKIKKLSFLVPFGYRLCD